MLVRQQLRAPCERRPLSLQGAGFRHGTFPAAKAFVIGSPTGGHDEVPSHPVHRIYAGVVGDPVFRAKWHEPACRYARKADRCAAFERNRYGSGRHGIDRLDGWKPRSDGNDGPRLQQDGSRRRAKPAFYGDGRGLTGTTGPISGRENAGIGRRSFAIRTRRGERARRGFDARHGWKRGQTPKNIVVWRKC